MKKYFKHYPLLLCFLFFSYAILRAESEKKSAQSEKLESIEKCGFVGTSRARKSVQGWLRDTYLVLHVGSDTFKLIRGQNKLVVQEIEKFIGKEVTVKGLLQPPTRKHVLPAIKVMSFSEGKSTNAMEGNLP